MIRADGFLISQFLSGASNKRSDEFGGSAEKRAELLLRVVRGVRKEVPKSFCIGVKINSADHMDSGGLEDMLRQVELIQREGIDYLQLSGGSFENPQVCPNQTECRSKSKIEEQMLSTQNSITHDNNNAGVSLRTSIREGFFLETSRRVRDRFPHLILIVTGGFRSQEGVNRALESGACDAVGLGRPAVKFPDLPNTFMFDGTLADNGARFDVESAPVPGWLAAKIRSVGAGAETVSKSLSRAYDFPI